MVKHQIKKFDLNTNTNGEHRAFVITGRIRKRFFLGYLFQFAI